MVRTLSQRTNPLLIELAEQLKVEHEIFAEKEPRSLNAMLPLVCEDIFSKKDAKKIIFRLKDHLTEKNLSEGGISKYLDAAICYYLLKKVNSGVPTHLAKFVHNNLNVFLSSRISFNSKGLALYFIQHSEPAIVAGSRQEIEARVAQLINRSNMQSAIDYGFGVELPKELKNRFFEVLESNIGAWSLERMSKLFLLIGGDNITEKHRDLLESRIRESMRSTEYSSIRFSLFQASKMINSNIPSEHLNEILSSLKSINTDWSKLIDEFKDGGVVVNLDGLDNVPSYSPNNDTWAYLAASDAGLSKVYTVSEKVFLEYKNLVKKGSKNTKPFSVLAIVIFMITLVLVTCIDFYVFISTSFNLSELISNTLEMNLLSAAESVGDYLVILRDLFINPIVLIIFSLWYIVKLFLAMIRKGTLRIWDYLVSIPIAGVIFSKIRE